MLPRRADALSHNACASWAYVFSDRALNALRLVQAQKLYVHCLRSALFISASGYMHLALASCRCITGMPAELRPNRGMEILVSQCSSVCAKRNTASEQPPFVASVRQQRKSGGSKRLVGLSGRVRVMRRAARARRKARSEPEEEDTWPCPNIRVRPRFRTRNPRKTPIDMGRITNVRNRHESNEEVCKKC